MKPTIKEISEQFSKGNFPFCYDHFADDIEWKIIGAKTSKGKEDTVAYCEKMMIEMATSTLNNTNIIAEHNHIVIEGYCNFTDADNNPGEVAYCDVFHFENQKIMKITSYCI